MGEYYLKDISVVDLAFHLNISNVFRKYGAFVCNLSSECLPGSFWELFNICECKTTCRKKLSLLVKAINAAMWSQRPFARTINFPINFLCPSACLLSSTGW